MTPLYLSANHGLSWMATSLAMAAMTVPGVLLQPWMGEMSDNISRRPLIVMGNSLGTALSVLVAIRAVLLASAVVHAVGREGINLGLTFAFMDGFAASAAVLAGLVGEKDLANAFLLGSDFTLVATYFAITTPKFTCQTVAA